jgi:hypothetical protein
MGQELILIGRLVDEPAIAPMLERMHGFLEERVGDDGVTRYQAPCPWDPTGCIVSYWSLATGCTIDYDTRGFTNELGYTALVFQHFDSPKYGAVMRFLDSLENGGVVADKWDYPISEEDPYWPWTSADTSVVNMSLIFWSLAAIPPAHGHGSDDLVRGTEEEESLGEGPPTRHAAKLPVARAGALLADRWPRIAAAEAARYCDDVPQPPGTAQEASPRIEAVTPNPGAPVTVRFALASPGPAMLSIHDLRGRLVRAFPLPVSGAGTQELRWDGRDDGGRPCARGVYFVRLRCGSAQCAARFVLALPRDAAPR